MPSEGREDLGLPSKLALLAGLMDISQVEMANRCGLSRITINRFFSVLTQIKTFDLAELMGVLGIDLEAHVDRRIGDFMGGVPAARDEIFVDVTRVLAGLDSQVKRTLLEQIHWWGKSALGKSAQGALERIQRYLQGAQA